MLRKPWYLDQQCEVFCYLTFMVPWLFCGVGGGKGESWGWGGGAVCSFLLHVFLGFKAKEGVSETPADRLDWVPETEFQGVRLRNRSCPGYVWVLGLERNATKKRTPPQKCGFFFFPSH